ncbi:MAG: UvrD-helicase domain-containing protein [Patescibacteria group bacterium]
MMDLLDNLNPEQVKAVKATEGPVLILAGAGSGKTKTLTSRVAYLVQTKKATPGEILAVTFTNKAAGEMKQRIIHLLRLRSDRAFHISTFHSLCARILRSDIQHIGRNQNFTILDTDEQLTATKQAMNDLNIDIQKFAPGAVLNYISSAKSELINAEEYPEMAYGYFQKVVAKVYPRYQEILLANNSLDFDDLLMMTVQLFRGNPAVLAKYQSKFKYLMVDEYQDTNTAQYQLMKLLADKHKNIFVCGDDWQSIYSFRGANYRNILNFNKDYPKAKIVKLEENYRSTQNLLNSAAAVIAGNKHRSEKELWTKNEEGDPITVKQVFNEQQEGSFIVQEVLQRKFADPRLEFNDFVVLYRTNAQSRSLEEAFLQQGIPYRIIGGTRFYDRKEIKDALAFLKVVANPQDDLSLKRIINLPPRGVGEKTWEELQKYAFTHNQPTSEILLDAPVGAKAQAELRKLGQIFTEARKNTKTLSKLFDFIMDRTGYLRWLDDKTIEGETRIENVKELKSVMEKYDVLDISIGLPTFLEEVSLIQDVDKYDATENAVNLMTLHSAKGLEFACVFIAGMEENLFPHSRSVLDDEELEEERRLCYVGITRAKQKLYLIYTIQRLIYGTAAPSMPSRFIDDIPAELRTNGDDSARSTEDIIPTASIRIKMGDWIEHKHFGPGKVISVTKTEVVAAFQRFGIKRLAKNLAPIKKIPSPVEFST